MNPSYLVRLLLLASASFFLLLMIFAAMVAGVAPAAIRRAEAMRPLHAARFLLSLRLLPAALSALAVVFLCLPSYLLFEPRTAGEEVGIACMFAALLGAGVGCVALYRTGAAWIRTRLYVRHCAGVEARAQGETVWIVAESSGLALAGVAHPRVMISTEALHGLSNDQLSIALKHEHAHRLSRDNFKRLLILLAPPVFSRVRTLERAWARYAEWSADDRATEGDADRSLALASALVKVARLQAGVGMPALVTSLVEPGEDLAERVDRLLNPFPTAYTKVRGEAIALAGIVFFMAAMAANPASLLIVHRVLETLLD